MTLPTQSPRVVARVLSKKEGHVNKHKNTKPKKHLFFLKFLKPINQLFKFFHLV